VNGRADPSPGTRQRASVSPPLSNIPRVTGEMGAAKTGTEGRDMARTMCTAAVNLAVRVEGHEPSGVVPALEARPERGGLRVVDCVVRMAG